MKSKKVDLVHYYGGERKIIGEAVVDIDGEYIDVTAKVTDPSYFRVAEIDPEHLSIGFKPSVDGGIEPTEAAHIPALGKILKGKGKRRGLR